MGIILQNAKRTLNYNRQSRTGFEKRLYLKWKEPFDLLEILIGLRIECGQAKKNKLMKKYGSISSPKHQALIKIHARSILISNEIFTLLKSGYVDGAYSRWRSLHELVVISYFLSENSDEVSRRYMEHDIIRRFKEAKEYQKYYRELDEEPFGRKQFNILKNEHDKLILKYGSEFERGRTGYEWIPTAILADRNFRALEDDAGLSRNRLFYNASSNNIHGGARGFYHMGLMNSRQKKILLVGPSNYGLADPIQYTSISLLQVTANLLHIEIDYDSLVKLKCIDNLVHQINPRAVRIQKEIEKEDAKFN
jgi:uncharacterized protein DUF5677